VHLSSTPKVQIRFLSSKDIQHLKITTILTSNHRDYQKALILENGQVITCSERGIIRIISLDTKIPEKVLVEHNNADVDLIQLKSGELCSASQDRMIKIWNIESGICTKTWSASSQKVRAFLELPNDILIESEYDKIHFLDLKSIRGNLNSTRTFLNKGNCRSIVLISNEEMASTSDKSIKVLSISGCDVSIKKFSGHKNRFLSYYWLQTCIYLVAAMTKL